MVPNILVIEDNTEIRNYLKDFLRQNDFNVHTEVRSKVPIESKIKIADLELDSRRIEVKRKEKKIHLTPQEFKLLEYLMNNKGTVLTREMILNRIWQYSPDIESRVVDVYIGYLRKKINKGFKKNLIRSVHGFGYSIHDE